MRNNLKELRKQKKVNIRQLALSIGVSRNTIYNWENSQSVISTVNVNKLMKFFECEFQDLFGENK